VLYYFIDARKWFTGPKITIDVQGMTEEQQRVLANEGLNLGIGEGVTMGGFTGKTNADEKTVIEKTGEDSN